MSLSVLCHVWRRTKMRRRRQRWKAGGVRDNTRQKNTSCCYIHSPCLLTTLSGFCWTEYKFDLSPQNMQAKADVRKSSRKCHKRIADDSPLVPSFLVHFVKRFCNRCRKKNIIILVLIVVVTLSFGRQMRRINKADNQRTDRRTKKKKHSHSSRIRH